MQNDHERYTLVDGHDAGLRFPWTRRFSQRPCLRALLLVVPVCHPLWQLCRAAMSMSDIIDASDELGRKREDRSATRAESSAMVELRPRAAERRAGGAGMSARGGRVVKVNLGSDGPNGWVGSTKLSRLEMELGEMRRKRPGAKAVVFSQVNDPRRRVVVCLVSSVHLSRGAAPLASLSLSLSLSFGGLRSTL